LNIQETALDLLVETNPTGHVQADGFFSRFLLVQKRMSKKKNVTISDVSPAAAAAAANDAATKAAWPTTSTHHHSPAPNRASPLSLAHKTSEEEGAGSPPCSPTGTAKLTCMHHRTQPSWSSSLQPGSNQVTLCHQQPLFTCNPRGR
jgi:hypothetical protein